MAEIRRLRSERRQAMEKDLEEAALLAEFAESQRETFDAANAAENVPSDLSFQFPISSASFASKQLLTRAKKQISPSAYLPKSGRLTAISRGRALPSTQPSAGYAS